MEAHGVTRINYFLMVAREENITKAAQLLHVTQPTLSRQLMQLEEELGIQLFHRGKYSMTLHELWQGWNHARNRWNLTKTWDGLSGFVYDSPFSTMENHYNLLYREDERELIPICKQMGVSLMPYSPLAGGHLARATWESDTLRGRTDRVAKGKYDRMEQQDIKIVARVQELAEKYNCKMSQIAIAWHLAKGVASPIIGATNKNPEQGVILLDEKK